MDELLKNPLFHRILIIFTGVIAVWVLIKFIQSKLVSRIKDVDHRYRAKKFGSFLGYFLTAILLLFVFREKLVGFTIALGVAGAGIAFALQEVIASFAGWLAIMFGGFYKTGDRVQLGGIKGDVMDIGVLRTTIMETGEWVNGDLYNGRIVLIANSFVFKEPVFNYSGDFPFLWDEIKVPIQFGSDYESVKEMLLNTGREVAGELPRQSREQWTTLQKKYRLEDAQTEPMVSLIANDNWVEFTLRYVVTYNKRRSLKTELFTRILKNIELSEGKIKLASATFHLVEAPEIKVKVNKN
ncbi:MAG: mechanosensitive ion channel family protein [Flavobacteriales bacterium]|nr:mechanosensitive ion channel family protein [Flavobacteriales bacterium]